MDFKQQYQYTPDDLGGKRIPLGDAAIWVAPLGNPAYQKELTRLQNEYQLELSLGVLTEEQTLAILVGAMAVGLLRNWENMTYGGQPLDYSVANAKRVLSEFEPFRDQVYQIARQLQQQRLRAAETDEKNSLTLFATSLGEAESTLPFSAISAEKKGASSQDC